MRVVTPGNLGPEFDIGTLTPSQIRLLPRFVFATRTTNVVLSAGLDITWQQMISGSNIALAGSTFTLTAGFVYELEAAIGLGTGGGTSSACFFAWVDAATNVQINGSAQGHPVASSVGGASGQQSSQGLAKLIYRPSVAQSVKVRVLSVNGTPPLQAVSSYAAIKVLH